MTRLRATANEYATDPDPIVTERRILETLEPLLPWDSMTRGALQRELFGTTLVGASRLASALGRLNNKGLVERLQSRRYRLTAKGREVLRLSAALQPNGGGAA